MADADSQVSKKPQKLAPQLSSDHANPSKFFSHFLYKAALITIFLVLLPFFPSLAPEFINQTLHARSWELLQLIFVGIAVSYGLFSKKNDETEKDHSSKMDNPQSYVSKLLQVSSVFDDESDTQTDENKIQTWHSQYYRGEPVVVVAKENPIVKEENNVSSEISQKPLLLPVRSLKQRVSDEVDLADESGGKNGSKRFISNSRKPRNGDVCGLNVQKFEEKLEENVVLPSPIPWRSRSGKMEMKENGDDSPLSFLVSPSPEERELNRVESRPFRLSKPNSSSKNLSPSPSISTPRRLSPPAPPPPPPPPFLRKPQLTKSTSTLMNNATPSEKILRRSVRSLPADELSEGEMDYETKFVEKKGYTDTKTYAKGRNKATESSDEESGGESDEVDYVEGSSGNGEAVIDNSVNDVGPDVDKKADEFIAKFREQIRLQRIESIRRSTAQRAGNKLR